MVVPNGQTPPGLMSHQGNEDGEGLKKGQPASQPAWPAEEQMLEVATVPKACLKETSHSASQA